MGAGGGDQGSSEKGADDARCAHDGFVPCHIAVALGGMHQRVENKEEEETSGIDTEKGCRKGESGKSGTEGKSQQSCDPQHIEEYTVDFSVHPVPAEKEHVTGKALEEAHQTHDDPHLILGESQGLNAPEGTHGADQGNGKTPHAAYQIAHPDHIGEARIIHVLSRFSRSCGSVAFFGEHFKDDESRRHQDSRRNTAKKSGFNAQKSEKQRPQSKAQTPGACVKRRGTDDAGTVVGNVTLHVHLEGGEKESSAAPCKDQPEELGVESVKDQQPQRDQRDTDAGTDKDPMGLFRFDDVAACKGKGGIDQRPDCHGGTHHPGGDFGFGKTVGGNKKNTAHCNIHHKGEKINQIFHKFELFQKNLPRRSMGSSSMTSSPEHR